MMAPPQIQVHDDRDQLNAVAAELLVQSVADALERRPRAAIALSGGSTPRRLYAALGRRPWRERIDWPRLHVFVVDERFVPPDDDESNERMIRETLLASSPLASSNFHPVPFMPGLPAESARAYEGALRAFFGVAERPAFDFVLLGMGPDGHTASLFPGTDAVNIKDRLVAATVNPAAQSQRISLTLPVLNAARTATFLVSGGDKGEAVRAVVDERALALPASHVNPEDGRLIWLLDAAAAAPLNSTR